MSFSERYGYKPVREQIQIEAIDEALRNSLWSVLKDIYWDTVSISSGPYGHYYLSSYSNEPLKVLCKRLWFSYFKEPLDRLDNDWLNVLTKLREYFFSCHWYNVYDFVEFIAENYPDVECNRNFMYACNTVLKREMSGYRFVNGKITQITDEEEVEAIEKAITLGEQLVALHLRRSLELLSDRTTPDYRNSIKESISAVETLVAKVTDSQQSTLGQLLKNLEEHVGLHSALKSAFMKLYGYTSDESGIRHALMDEDNVDFYDAKFMLVTCSAFVNYIKGKLREM